MLCFPSMSLFPTSKHHQVQTGAIKMGLMEVKELSQGRKEAPLSQEPEFSSNQSN